MPQAADSQLTRYHKILFALLCTATLFEGFDTKLSNLLLPLLGDEFGAGPEALGNALAVLGFGSVVAFFVIRLADRVGRRPMMLFAVGGYALLTLLTALTESLAQFAAVQFIAKTLLVTQLALGYVILSEELPARMRGRSNGLLGAFASVGAALPAVFLAPLEETSVGWRGLFLLGALPLLLLPVFWRVLRETAAFRARKPGRDSMIDQAKTIFASGLRRRFLGITLLWFTVNFSSACTMFFFSYYVFNERGWTASDLQIVVPAAVPFAFLGYAAGGRLADAVGRRAAAASFLLLASVVANIGYRAEGWWVIAGSWVALQMLQGIWPIANTITAELFPDGNSCQRGGLRSQPARALGRGHRPADRGLRRGRARFDGRSGCSAGARKFRTRARRALAPARNPGGRDQRRRLGESGPFRQRLKRKAKRETLGRPCLRAPTTPRVAMSTSPTSSSVRVRSTSS